MAWDSTSTPCGAKGLGLVSMKERLEAIGGSLEIRSSPGMGTRVEATVPLDVVAKWRSHSA